MLRISIRPGPDGQPLAPILRDQLEPSSVRRSVVAMAFRAGPKKSARWSQADMGSVIVRCAIRLRGPGWSFLTR